MKQESIDKLKSLRRFAKAAHNFWPQYAKRISDPSCDKHDARFCGDSRFVVFKVKDVHFSAHTGYYGNSDCSTFGSGFDAEHVQTYFVKALNALKKDIFTKMADFAEADAAQLADAAEQELQQLQALVEEARKHA